jgi:hypothetical protein
MMNNGNIIVRVSNLAPEYAANKMVKCWGKDKAQQIGNQILKQDTGSVQESKWLIAFNKALASA